jgi:hypothetical protein
MYAKHQDMFEKVEKLKYITGKEFRDEMSFVKKCDENLKQKVWIKTSRSEPVDERISMFEVAKNKMKEDLWEQALVTIQICFPKRRQLTRASHSLHF